MDLHQCTAEKKEGKYLQCRSEKEGANGSFCVVFYLFWRRVFHVQCSDLESGCLCPRCYAFLPSVVLPIADLEKLKFGMKFPNYTVTTEPQLFSLLLVSRSNSHS